MRVKIGAAPHRPIAGIALSQAGAKEPRRGVPAHPRALAAKPLRFGAGHRVPLRGLVVAVAALLATAAAAGLKHCPRRRIESRRSAAPAWARRVQSCRGGPGRRPCGHRQLRV